MQKLPIVDPKFTFVPAPRAREIVHSYSRGLCPTYPAKSPVDGVRVLRDGKVFLRKQCREHGESEALISGDADWFLRSRSRTSKKARFRSNTRPAWRRAVPTIADFAPTTSSTLACRSSRLRTTAISSARSASSRIGTTTTMTQGEFRKILDGLIAKEGQIETINLSGGEPTMHPQLLEFLDMARAKKEISRVSISTNGLRVATEPAFCDEIARRKAPTSRLQLDALQQSRAPGVSAAAGDQRARAREARSRTSSAPASARRSCRRSRAASTTTPSANA